MRAITNTLYANSTYSNYTEWYRSSVLYLRNTESLSPEASQSGACHSCLSVL